MNELSSNFNESMKVLKWRLVLLLNLFILGANAQNLDIDILKEVNVNRNTNLDKPMKLWTNTAYPLSAALPLGLGVAGFLSKDKSLQWRSLSSFSSLIVSMGSVYVLKKTINRARPADKYPFILPQMEEHDSSFPSGHTTAAFTTATTLALEYKKWYIAVPAYLWAGGVAYSRLHAGVHYPSDLLAGAVIGAGSAWLSHRANRWLHKKK